MCKKILTKHLNTKVTLAAIKTFVLLTIQSFNNAISDSYSSLETFFPEQKMVRIRKNYQAKFHHLNITEYKVVLWSITSNHIKM